MQMYGLGLRVVGTEGRVRGEKHGIKHGARKKKRGN